MENDWGTTCSDCGSRFYRSEVPAGHSLGDKVAVHKQMGCNPLGDPAPPA